MSNALSIKQHPTVNGINVDDVKALIETVKRDPSNGLTEWKVTSTWEDRTHIRANIESFNIGGRTVKRPFNIDIANRSSLEAATPTPIRRSI